MKRFSSVSHDVIGAAIEVHRHLGPGLLESAYEECLCEELSLRHVEFERQAQVPLVYKGRRMENGYRVDLLVGDIVVEIKAVTALQPVHDAQLLTYLRLLDRRVGFLFNFHVPVLRDGGIRRLVNRRVEPGFPFA